MRKLLAVLILAPALALAGPGLWYEPSREGHGITISKSDGGFGVIWWLYNRDRTATFLLAEPCPELPCATALFLPSANWLGGDLDMGDEIGSIEIQPQGDALRVVYDLTGLSPDECQGSPGGLLFAECFGTITFERLTP